jgi:hypothetical protein
VAGEVYQVYFLVKATSHFNPHLGNPLLFDYAFEVDEGTSHELVC